jgi:hypothetical protein
VLGSCYVMLYCYVSTACVMLCYVSLCQDHHEARGEGERERERGRKGFEIEEGRTRIVHVGTYVYDRAGRG